MSSNLSDTSADDFGISRYYEVKEQLGKKSGRRTLLARDLTSDELVVIKQVTFNPDFEWDDLKLFEREAETLRCLSHPAIPSYLDFFEVRSDRGNGFALVQSYIPAQNLEQYLKSCRSFTKAEVKEIAKSLLETLIYLHSQNPPVIHRDIKPSNILIGNTPNRKSQRDRNGDNSIGKIYLVDFGSVQTMAAKEGGTMTVVGTYGYMPPEQFGGRANPASDLYSVGATLIYLITGHHPADLPQNNLQLQFEHLVDLEPGFTAWLKQMCEPSLDQRFQSASDAINALSANDFGQPYLVSKKQTSQKQTPRNQSQIESIRQEIASIEQVSLNELFTQSVIRFTMNGLVCGSLFGALYGSVIPVAGTIMGGFIGLFFGGVLGVINGLSFSLLTSVFFSPMGSTQFYRRAIAISSCIVTFASVIFISKLYPSSDGVSAILDSIIPGIIATLAAGFTSQRLALWYLRRLLEPQEYKKLYEREEYAEYDKYRD
jgi:eukaryotic-like serine/threonine-protein kinase